MLGKQVQDAYSSVAGLYIDLFGAVGKNDPADVALISRHLNIRPGTVLDLGCGPGHMTDHLRSLGVDAVGIDLVPEFIAHARATYPDGDYRLGSMTELDAADGSIAGILAWYSTIHLPPDDLDPALAEFRRVLAPGGTLVIGIFDGAAAGSVTDAEPFDHKVTTAYRWLPDAFGARLAKAGFTETDRELRPAERTQRPLAAIAAVMNGL